MYWGRCMKLFATPVKTFYGASERCMQDGAHLYHFKTEDDRQPLVDLMDDNGEDIGSKGNVGLITTNV